MICQVFFSFEVEESAVERSHSQTRLYPPGVWRGVMTSYLKQQLRQESGQCNRTIIVAMGHPTKVYS